MRAILCVALAAALAPGSATALADSFALTGGTVHTVSGAVLPNATVVVQDGRITAVGAGARPPEGVRVVNVTGRHVYPGLISANTVMGLVEVRTIRGSVDHTETGRVNPHVRAETQINPGSAHIEVARVNGITTTHVIPQGSLINGTSALIRLDGWTFEDMTVKAPVGLAVQWPTMRTVRSTNERRSADQQRKDRDAAIEEIRQAFDDARAYWKARQAEGTRGVPRHDHDTKWNALGMVLRGEIPVLFHASTLKQIESVLEFADDQELTNVVLVDGEDAPLVAGTLRERGIRVIVNKVYDLPRRDYEPYDHAYTLAARLHEAGVEFCLSDGGGRSDNNPSPMNARNLPYQAALAASFGLPRDEALKAITLYPARILGVDDRLGSIEAGKIADLVVTDGDIFEITTTVEQVYIAGHAIPMTSRHTRLFEKHDSRPRGAHARPRPDETRGAQD